MPNQNSNRDKLQPAYDSYQAQVARELWAQAWAELDAMDYGPCTQTRRDQYGYPVYRTDGKDVYVR